VAYVVGQTIEVCLDLRLPPSRGIRRIVGVFLNECGEAIELTEVPATASQCVLQDPSQTALQGRVARPDVYELWRLEVQDLRGVTPVNPPEISLAVENTQEAVERRPA
jgi:hypothetical protein